MTVDFQETIDRLIENNEAVKAGIAAVTGYIFSVAARSKVLQELNVNEKIVYPLLAAVNGLSTFYITNSVSYGLLSIVPYTLFSLIQRKKILPAAGEDHSTEDREIKILEDIKKDKYKNRNNRNNLSEDKNDS